MSEIIDTSKLGLRKKKKREMKTVIDPLSKMNSGIKMVVTEYTEKSPVLTPEEAAHIPADLWKEIPKGHHHGRYGKYRCIVNGDRFFCDSIAEGSVKPPPLMETLIKKTPDTKKGRQLSAKAAMKGR